MSSNPLQPSIKPTISQDSLSNYSRPFPFPEEKQEFADILQTLPLEENLQNWLFRLKEAQAKSFQSRMNLIKELGKKELFNEKEAKEDDLEQFFTNNRELMTLNEEILEENEEEKLEKKAENHEHFPKEKNYEYQEGKSKFFPQQFPRKTEEFPHKTKEFPFKTDEFPEKTYIFPPKPEKFDQFFTDPLDEISTEGTKFM